MLFRSDTLRIVSWGGAYQKGQSLGIFQPAAKAMGITVKEDTYGGISDVKLMVKSGADKFDIFSSGAGSCASGAAEGVLEKLDYSVIDVSNHLPGMYSDYCAGADIFSDLLYETNETVFPMFSIPVTFTTFDFPHTTSFANLAFPNFSGVNCSGCATGCNFNVFL